MKKSIEITDGPEEPPSSSEIIFETTEGRVRLKIISQILKPATWLIYGRILRGTYRATFHPKRKTGELESV